MNVHIIFAPTPNTPCLAYLTLGWFHSKVNVHVLKFIQCRDPGLCLTLLVLDTIFPTQLAPRLVPKRPPHRHPPADAQTATAVATCGYS